MTKIPRLFELLKQKGITAKTLSDNTGASTGNISDWKSGRTSPSTDKLVKIAEYLETTTDYLLGNTDNPRQPDTTIKDEDIMFALFDGEEVTPEMYDEVKEYAKFIAKRKKDNQSK